jgi:hypothetical protein
LSVGRNGVVLCENPGGSPLAVVSKEAPLAGWTHIAIAYKNGVPSLYIDGNLAGTGAKSQSIVHPAIREEYMDQGATFFDGDTTEIELSTEPLSVADIQDRFAKGLPNPEEPPVVELNGGNTSRSGILCWQPGKYDLKDRNNNSLLSATVKDVEAAAEIVSPWTVRFPSGSGAPAEITLEKLISLHRHPVDGVKYFSGTAAYLNTFSVAKTTLAENKRLFLDLGRVEVLAELVINDKDMGIFWKPPYRIDITDFVKEGDNQLEVRVTNLWPNRLIGDEQLPAEHQYGMQRDGTIIKDPDATNIGIVDVPEWYLTSKPRPAGQRIAFSVWRHYNKNAPLLESGLIGPVKIRQAYLIDLA